ncbi:MoaD/ThiS family protein [Halostella sp. PRR32]|uniref:MoaD/ThiS family protein n=1 Tax=Halostella sp. PRR32 TaxID=3098147 RepID=UPI002B1E677A|nr:MoaD/ThiS family protein [Halostella sp. PRR32]
MKRLPLDRKRIGIVLIVGALVLAAGCTGIGGDETNTETETIENSNATAGDEANATDDGSAETTTAADAAATGKIAVAVNGTRLDITEEYNSSSEAFRVNDSANDVWHRSNETVTLAEALATLGLEATADTLTHDGTTYDDSANGTTVTVRVNGEAVDPERYELQDGDEVWVVATTSETNTSAPEEHIRHEDLHVHGNITFEVDGEEVDFSRDKYQNADHSQYFHFENGAGEPWHAHAWNVTLGYGMSTLEGINVTEDSVTYENETYVDGENGASVSVEVNGEPVDPNGYVLKDGDSIRIVVDTGA